MRRLLGMLLLALTAGTLVPAVSAAAGTRAPLRPRPQQFGVRLVDVPVSEADNPRGLRYIIDYLPPGTVIHRRIMVENQEARKEHFTVYADAAQITGGSFLGDSGATRSELTQWISIQHGAVTLPPYSSVLDMVAIKVPDTPTRGEHYGVIWVQQVAYRPATAGFAIREVSRVGIRIYLAVGPGGMPPTNFAISSVTGHLSATGQRLLTAQVRDTGGRALDLSGTAALTGGPGGTSAGPFPIQRIMTLAPGQSDPVTFILPSQLPDGPWRATVTLVSGLTTRTASATVRFGGGGGPARWAQVAILAWTAGMILALIVLGWFLAQHRRNKRRAGPRPREHARA